LAKDTPLGVAPLAEVVGFLLHEHEPLNAGSGTTAATAVIPFAPKKRYK